MELFLIQQIYATLFATNNKIQTMFDKQYKDLTLRQFMLLLAISHIPEGECTFNRLAKQLGTSKQNIKQLVTILKEKRYILVEASKVDKRAKNISLTQGGIEIGVAYAEVGNVFLNNIASQFTMEELEQLWNLLKRFYAFDGVQMDGFDIHPNNEKGRD
ncbi:DNA-binding MarR family transcriptional regulator [Lachnotalea glycerini]|uniref:DNA-binding MarR family transcriptional regulator n=1 Tax=Lachnotalea glycerini TaxID=1763509 RepID=A0A318EJ73_9FIRM|nr:MarR family winged helix-turn-helix transcriptional regulator [Lachnotalea glycerini]PXV87327.1 DNA-binding MarR family transcriptional regulator [Lachnotalea glycerini]